MTRGIHLKQLRNADLIVLGVTEGRVPEEGETPGQVRLSEADPVMAQLIREARAGLEEVLALLNAALGGGGAKGP